MNDAIERLYGVFSAYPHPRALDGCPCCTSAQMAKPLVTKPLRTLDGQDLERYAFKALTTWGAVEDYKYFLPRIIELSMSGELLWDIEMTLGKLEYGDFPSWPLREREAIEVLIVEAWADAVRKGAVEDADALLCGRGPGDGHRSVAGSCGSDRSRLQARLPDDVFATGQAQALELLLGSRQRAIQDRSRLGVRVARQSSRRERRRSPCVGKRGFSSFATRPVQPV